MSASARAGGLLDGFADSTGSYALLLRCVRRRRVAVGSLGTVELVPGRLLYIGSAFGPGGLGARLGRHASLDHVHHWHLDYVRPLTSLAGAWVCSSSRRLEHRWARAIAALPAASVPAARFGASDCRCRSHLFALPTDCSLETVVRALRRSSEGAVVEISAAALRSLARARSRGTRAGDEATASSGRVRVSTQRRPPRWMQTPRRSPCA